MARYFTPEEVAGLDPRLIDMLDRARGIAKVPFIITSGLRSVEENAGAGGVSDSSHLRGLAVDLRCQESRARYFMISALLAAGFTRIGLYSAHLHVDIDSTLPPMVAWVGVSH